MMIMKANEYRPIVIIDSGISENIISTIFLIVG